MTIENSDNEIPDNDTPIDVNPDTETPDSERPLASQVAGVPKVRPAKPDADTDTTDDDWDEVDQAADESFPASDPPGQGVG